MPFAMGPTNESPQNTGNLQALEDELLALDPGLRERLARSGFSAEQLKSLAGTLGAGDAESRRAKRNRVQGPVSAPSRERILDPATFSAQERDRLRALGRSIAEDGKLAFAVLAGGMATRMGGVVKALVPATGSLTFLDARLRENEALEREVGGRVELWIMSSAATHAALSEALDARGVRDRVQIFEQNTSLRLDESGRLFRDDEGNPSTYAPGHGDFQDAALRSGVLDAFIARGGEYVWVTNVDNLGAGVDFELLGLFASRTEELMVEVTDKDDRDRGGIPVTVGDHVEVLEEFRLPPDFDPAEVRVFNTNTMLARAAPLARAKVDWHWFEVEKKVGDRKAIQFERLLQELTAVMPTIYVRVPREGAASRFLPVKDAAELERRKDAIRMVLEARGVVG